MSSHSVCVCALEISTRSFTIDRYGLGCLPKEIKIKISPEKNNGQCSEINWHRHINAFSPFYIFCVCIYTSRSKMNNSIHCMNVNVAFRAYNNRTPMEWNLHCLSWKTSISWMFQVKNGSNKIKWKIRLIVQLLLF